MSTIQDDLDAAIPAAPTLPSVEDTLHAGRTALRRRRQSAAAGLVAAAAVVGVVAATGLAAGGTGDARPAHPAVQSSEPVPTPGATPTWLLRDHPPVLDGHDGDMVMYDTDGVLLVRPGAQVVHRWENPMDLPEPGKSLAMVIENAGTTYWTFAVWDGVVDAHGNGPEGATITIEPSDARGFPFERWVQDEMPIHGIGWPDPDFVRLGHDGRLTPLGDATILAQTSDAPRLVPPQADAVAVALVQTGPAQLCVAAAQAPGRAPEYLYLPASMYGPDLAGCVANLPAWNIRS